MSLSTNLSSFFIIKRKLSNGFMAKVIKRTVYNASHVVYPSSKWFDGYSNRSGNYQELINPAMSANMLSPNEVIAVKTMLNEQGNLLKKFGSASLLNPIRQTVDQYLYGVSDLIDTEAVSEGLASLDIMDEWGYLNERYKEIAFQNGISANVLQSALNGISSSAMDTIYFANMWLYIGQSKLLLDRPIVILQTPKYPVRQIERYYGIIACMALGVTPVLVGMDSQQRYHFEGMADVLPVNDKFGNSLLLVVNSSRTQIASYNELKYIHNGLSIKQHLPERLLILDVQEKRKDLFFHLDLIMHINDNGTVYLGKDVLTRESEAMLVHQIGDHRVQYIPYEETKLFGLNTVLYDRRFGTSNRVALIKEDSHVLKRDLAQKGYHMCSFKEAFPHGGGSVRCRMASIDVGTPHNLDSFLEEQSHIEEVLGPDYVVVSTAQKVFFEKIFDSSHVRDILETSDKIVSQNKLLGF